MASLKSLTSFSALAGALLVGTFVPTTQAHADTQFSYGGYLKFDAMVTRTDSGALPSGSIGRDFYVPSLTPIGGDANTYTDFHIRESRFFFRATQELANGENITGYVEFDFLGTPNGDKRVTNSYTPRVRHAYIQYQNWLAGQFWSNFMDVTIIPESPDFIGNPDGIVFNRQPQIRYTTANGWSFSVEAPETTVTPYQGGTARITTGDTAMPDLTARYQAQFENVHVSLAGIYRQLEYRQQGVNDTTAGYGIALSTKIDIGPHDVRAGIVHGEGIGRYVGVNSTNDAVITQDLNLDALGYTGFTVAYRHVWSEQYRTNVIFTRGQFKDQRELTGVNANDHTQRVAVNLMYQANEKLIIGAELSQANRELLSADDGALQRFQLSVRYAF
ncbi:DcaP family trimeric outer membrane transporter [Aliidiomarina indica]|uniref:DcaP family trimeric outer membrane transporter n=1 Tax=Aliidiomarina indica TaxID=2749147 RepID=UPI00188F1F4B|nr:DcaP family trimeric outer membrane transporter [Aliidiomarina indica]